MKLNTGPDLGVLCLAMAWVIIPLARPAQTASFGVTESKGRDGCNYQQKAQEIKRLKCGLYWQTASLFALKLSTCRLSWLAHVNVCV